MKARDWPPASIVNLSRPGPLTVTVIVPAINDPASEILLHVRWVRSTVSLFSAQNRALRRVMSSPVEQSGSASESAQVVTTRVTAAMASEAGSAPTAASARHIADRRAPGRLGESPLPGHAFG